MRLAGRYCHAARECSQRMTQQPNPQICADFTHCRYPRTDTTGRVRVGTPCEPHCRVCASNPWFFAEQRKNSVWHLQGPGRFIRLFDMVKLVDSEMTFYTWAYQLRQAIRSPCGYLQAYTTRQGLCRTCTRCVVFPKVLNRNLKSGAMLISAHWPRIVLRHFALRAFRRHQCGTAVKFRRCSCLTQNFALAQLRT